MKAAQHQRLLAASLAITRALLLLAVMLLWLENRVWAFASAPQIASAQTAHATPLVAWEIPPLAAEPASGCCVAAEEAGLTGTALARSLGQAGESAAGIIGNTQRIESQTGTIQEQWGVIGVVGPEQFPFLGLLSLILPAIAMGNQVVALAPNGAQRVADELRQVIARADPPNGVASAVAGQPDALAAVLADHQAVAAVWSFGAKTGLARVEQRAAARDTPVWSNPGSTGEWTSPTEGQGQALLRPATWTKTVWLSS